MPNKNPLGEIFGFPIDDTSKRCIRMRKHKICPFGNISPNCTKDKANDPLGVCSVIHEGHSVITCPVRFREDWIIIENAAAFVFPESALWSSVSEVKLIDEDGQSAGNIDYVIVQIDENGKVIDFASIEVQGVYITGNLRNPFVSFLKSPSSDFNWDGPNYPHPDYLSSSRKRLIPQMLSKGGIFKSWGKKQCIVIQKSFYDTLPLMPKVNKSEADVAWFLYDLLKGEDGLYHLTLVDIVYTEFNTALASVIKPKAANMEQFILRLQTKLEEKYTTSPETPKTILDIQ